MFRSVALMKLLARTSLNSNTEFYHYQQGRSKDDRRLDVFRVPITTQGYGCRWTTVLVSTVHGDQSPVELKSKSSLR